jgi:hypothetical protein
LSEVLEILDPPISETELSGFVELGSVEQIFALRIGCKPNYLVCQTGTFSFSRKLNLPQFDWRPDASCTKSFATVFSSKRAIISKHLLRYAFKDPLRQWKVPAIYCTTNNESPNASTLKSAGNLLHN